MLAGSLFAFGNLKIGLEQQLVLPTGSYLKPYFDQQAELGEAGPPVYIVLQNVNYSDPYVRTLSVAVVRSGLGCCFVGVLPVDPSRPLLAPTLWCCVYACVPGTQVPCWGHRFLS